MARVVSLSEHRVESQVEAWEAYCCALRKAQDTQSIVDGIEAGRAWRRWLDLFMSPDQRRSLSAAVLPSERRV